LIDRTVSEKYAEALFGAAVAEGVTDALRDDFESLDSLLDDDDSLIRFLASPMELDEDKERIVTQVFGGRTTDLFVRLLLLLLRKNRILHLHDIALSYSRVLEASRGIIDARITSARTMSPTQERKLVLALEKLTGRRIKVRRRIDPRLVAGFQVLVGGKVIDYSVRHRLDTLRDSLMKTGSRVRQAGPGEPEPMDSGPQTINGGP
jgi:F-type H+-transporting ATPase subunit delta